MKNCILILVTLLAFTAQAQTDEESIKQVITTSYIEGIHNRGNIDDIRKGFHPTFKMLRMADNDIKPLPIEEWITNIEKSRQQQTTSSSRTEGKFVNIDVTGNAAVVKLELSKEGKKIFTDYMVLYKFTEGWRIVSKTFYRHQ